MGVCRFVISSDWTIKKGTISDPPPGNKFNNSPPSTTMSRATFQAVRFVPVRSNEIIMAAINSPLVALHLRIAIYKSTWRIGDDPPGQYSTLSSQLLLVLVLLFRLWNSTAGAALEGKAWDFIVYSECD